MRNLREFLLDFLDDVWSDCTTSSAAAFFWWLLLSGVLANLYGAYRAVAWIAAHVRIV